VIQVTQTSAGEPLRFHVTLRDGGRETRHEVTMSDADYQRLCGGHGEALVIEAAFRFLLDREPKEAILAHFDLSLISRYFPEFERLLPSYLT
jgi:hypothetical protein